MFFNHSIMWDNSKKNLRVYRSSLKKESIIYCVYWNIARCLPPYLLMTNGYKYVTQSKLNEVKKFRKEASCDLPAKSCSSWLGPLTGGRDVLVLNLPTGHTKRISTQFYKHKKHPWYTCCSHDDYVCECETCILSPANTSCYHFSLQDVGLSVVKSCPSPNSHFL